MEIIIGAIGGYFIGIGVREYNIYKSLVGAFLIWITGFVIGVKATPQLQTYIKSIFLF